MGIKILGAGIRDIILPGDVKEIMNQVLIAEKKAQANVIMRREETASTRSLLNTAKLMDENTMLYRLKEMEFIEKRLWYYAYLNSGLKLVFNGRSFYSRRGLYDLLAKELGEDKLYDLIYYKSDKLEFCFSHTNAYGENYFSFVNGQYTVAGGTHQSAFREGILKGVNDFSKKSFA